MNKLESVEYYLKHHAIPNKLGRVIYISGTTRLTHITINLIKRAGLTPIPANEYRRVQASTDRRPYLVQTSRSPLGEE